MIHLIIPDAHTHKGDDFTRFACAGNYIVSNKPDKIIIIGDFGDFESVCKFNKPGSLLIEGQRVVDDINACEKALNILFEPTIKYNKQRKNKKKSQWWPKLYYLEGNHEYRLSKYIEEHAILEGAFDLPQRLKRCYDLTYIRYGRYIDVDDILYTHIPFKNGVPLQSVVNTCGSALAEVVKSVVFGHTHRWEVKQTERAGKKGLITALNVGAFFEGLPDYLKDKDTSKWWKGLTQLDVYDNSEFDIATISMEKLKREY